MSNQGSDVERDTAHCPFCGTDAVNADFCAHLIADFGDGSDGKRGIMCGSEGSRSGNVALDGLETLERTLSDFVAAAKSAGYVAESPRKVGLAAVARALGFENQAP